MRQRLLPLSLFLTLLLLQACGGGDGSSSGSSGVSYSGATTQAEVDSSNSQDLGTATASGARQAIVSSAVDVFGVMRPAPDLEDRLLDVSPSIAEWIAQTYGYAAKTTDLSSTLCTTGYATADTNTEETVGTISFSSCGIDDGNGSVIVLTGMVSFTILAVGNQIDDLSMSFNVTASYGGETASISLTISCLNLTGTGSCSVTSDFVGLDDRVYRVTNISVGGDAYTGYYVNATVYDPAHGNVGLTTTVPLLFECSGGQPSTGTVVISGANSSSATITFDDCSQFTVTVGSVGYPYSW